MAYFNILSKCDAALVAYIVQNGAGTPNDVFPAKRSLDKSLPCTIVASRRARPHPDMPYSGVRIVDAMVYIRQLGIDEEEAWNEAGLPKQRADERVSKTFDLFQSGLDNASNDLAAAITEAAVGSGMADLTVQACRIIEEQAEFEGKGDSWSDILHLELIACPADVG